MAYVNLNFVPGEILTAAKMNLLAANDASFHDGTGIGDGSIQPQHLSLTAALTEQDIIKEVINIGYGLKATMTRVGNLVFANVGGTVTLPTTLTRLSEKIPDKFCPAGFLGTVSLCLVAHNSGKVNGYASYRISPDGSILCGATNGHNEWYGTDCWFTDRAN